MLIDDVVINVSAGRGGDGLVGFSKIKMSRGPTGGDGGRGGNVIIETVDDLGALRRFRNEKKFRAPGGGAGEQNCRAGASGEDLILRVPVGTVAHVLKRVDIESQRQEEKEKGRTVDDTRILNDGTDGEEPDGHTGERTETYELTHKGQRIVIAKGGNGGFGNFHYRSSRHTTPERANPGAPGEKLTLRLELKLIADIGFVGYPNVGKSTLLNALTNASSKVANYQFTTLEPHLGVYYELILADIPGLIDGAADGRGLGHKFLRHVERTRIIFHFVSAASEHPLVDYQVIRAELGAYNKELLDKPEWVIVSQADLSEPERLAETVAVLKKENPHVVTLSIEDEESVTGIKKILNDIKDQK